MSRFIERAAIPGLLGASRMRSGGFSLLELMLAATIAALLIGVAVPSYRAVIERQRVSKCISELAWIAMRIEKHRTMNNFRPPNSLAELSGAPLVDPWGFEYRYLNFAAGGPGVQGQIRKDQNLHPLNSEFDLYSVGRDGLSRPPLTARHSRDDVIWGRDGAFIGLAKDF